MDGQYLERLLERMPAGHMALGFVVNSMLDDLAAKKGKEVAEEVQGRYLKKRPISLLRHPAHELFKVAFACAETLHPDNLERGLWEAGYALCGEFFRTPAGKMLLSVVGRKDPSRLFANEPTAYSTVFSWGKRAFRKSGPREMELVHSEDFLPVPLNVGTMTAAMHIIDVESGRVTGTVTGLDAGRYVVTW